VEKLTNNTAKADWKEQAGLARTEVKG